MLFRRHLILSSVFLAFSAHAEDSDFVSSRGGNMQTMNGASSLYAARDELAPPVPQEQEAPTNSGPAKPHVHPQPQVPAGWSSLSDPSIGDAGGGAFGLAGGESGYGGSEGNGHPIPQVPAGYTQVGGYGDEGGVQGMPTASMGYALQGMANTDANGNPVNDVRDRANYGAFVSSLMRYINGQPGQQVGTNGRPYASGAAFPGAMNINCGAGMTAIYTPAGVMCR